MKKIIITALIALMIYGAMASGQSSYEVFPSTVGNSQDCYFYVSGPPNLDVHTIMYGEQYRDPVEIKYGDVSRYYFSTQTREGTYPIVIGISKSTKIGDITIAGGGSCESLPAAEEPAGTSAAPARQVGNADGCYFSMISSVNEDMNVLYGSGVKYSQKMPEDGKTKYYFRTSGITPGTYGIGYVFKSDGGRGEPRRTVRRIISNVEITGGNQNCENLPGTDRTGDNDGDGIPDATDPDDDNDGVPDTTDRCPLQRGPASNSGCPETLISRLVLGRVMRLILTIGTASPLQITLLPESAYVSSDAENKEATYKLTIMNPNTFQTDAFVEDVTEGGLTIMLDDSPIPEGKLTMLNGGASYQKDIKVSGTGCTEGCTFSIRISSKQTQGQKVLGQPVTLQRTYTITAAPPPGIRIVGDAEKEGAINFSTKRGTPVDFILEVFHPEEASDALLPYNAELEAQAVSDKDRAWNNVKFYESVDGKKSNSAVSKTQLTQDAKVKTIIATVTPPDKANTADSADIKITVKRKGEAQTNEVTVTYVISHHGDGICDEDERSPTSALASGQRADCKPEQNFVCNGPGGACSYLNDARNGVAFSTQVAGVDNIDLYDLLVCDADSSESDCINKLKEGGKKAENCRFTPSSNDAWTADKCISADLTYDGGFSSSSQCADTRSGFYFLVSEKYGTKRVKSANTYSYECPFIGINSISGIYSSLDELERSWMGEKSVRISDNNDPQTSPEKKAANAICIDTYSKHIATVSRYKSRIDHLLGNPSKKIPANPSLGLKEEIFGAGTTNLDKWREDTFDPAIREVVQACSGAQSILQITGAEFTPSPVQKGEDAAIIVKATRKGEANYYGTVSCTITGRTEPLVLKDRSGSQCINVLPEAASSMTEFIGYMKADQNPGALQVTCTLKGSLSPECTDATVHDTRQVSGTIYTTDVSISSVSTPPATCSAGTGTVQCNVILAGNDAAKTGFAGHPLYAAGGTCAACDIVVNGARNKCVYAGRSATNPLISIFNCAAPQPGEYQLKAYVSGEGCNPARPEFSSEGTTYQSTALCSGYGDGILQTGIEECDLSAPGSNLQQQCSSRPAPVVNGKVATKTATACNAGQCAYETGVYLCKKSAGAACEAGEKTDPQTVGPLADGSLCTYYKTCNPATCTFAPGKCEPTDIALYITPASPTRAQDVTITAIARVGVQNLALTVDRASKTLAQSGLQTYVHTISRNTLPIGQHTATLTASDASGNTYQTSKTFTISNTAPTISGISMADGDQCIEGKAITVRCHAADPDGILRQSNGVIEINGNALTQLNFDSATGTYSKSYTLPASGTDINVKCTVDDSDTQGDKADLAQTPLCKVNACPTSPRFENIALNPVQPEIRKLLEVSFTSSPPLPQASLPTASLKYPDGTIVPGVIFGIDGVRSSIPDGSYVYKANLFSYSGDARLVISGTSDGCTGESSRDVFIKGTIAPAPSSVGITANPTIIRTADGKSVITATLKDANGMPIPYETTVWFNATKGVLSRTWCETRSDESSCSVQLTATGTAEQSVVTASWNGKTAQTTVSFSSVNSVDPVGIFNPKPTGTVAPGSYSLSVVTDKSATCKYSTTDAAFESTSMTLMIPTPTRQPSGVTTFVQTSSSANFAAGTYTYYFKCRDEFLNEVSLAHSFSVQAAGIEGGGTAPAEPLTMIGVAHTPGQTTSLITWQTNKNSDSTVEYGTTTALGKSAGAGASENTMSHRIELTGLVPDTEYHYRACSRAGAENECTEGGRFRTLALSPPDLVPTAVLRASPTGNQREFTFTVAITSGDAPLTYSWDFNNDATSDASTTTNTAVHAYFADGIYTAKVIVRDSDGDTAEATIIISVVSQPPERDMTVDIGATPTDGTVPLNVLFTTSVSDGFGTKSYSWNFGAGTSIITTSVPFVQHTYSTAGTYNAKVAARDARGRTGESGTIRIVVSPAGGCTNSWSWTPWTPDPCPASDMQTRIVTDANSCPTQAGKPAESQTCTPAVIEKTCSAGTLPASPAGVEQGPATYTGAALSWIYLASGELTACKWRCGFGYSQSGSSCVSTFAVALRTTPELPVVNQQFTMDVEFASTPRLYVKGITSGDKQCTSSPCQLTDTKTTAGTYTYTFLKSDLSQQITKTVTVRGSNAPTVTEPVFADPSVCQSGGAIRLKCRVNDADAQDRENLKVDFFAGKCDPNTRTDTTKCFDTRDWRDFPVGNQFAGTKESTGIYYITYSIPVSSSGKGIAATCRGQDQTGEWSNWGDAYPVCVIDVCNNAPRITGLQTFRGTESAERTQFTKAEILTIKFMSDTAGIEPAVKISSGANEYAAARQGMGTTPYEFRLALSGVQAGSYQVIVAGIKDDACIGSRLADITVQETAAGPQATGCAAGNLPADVTNVIMSTASGTSAWSYKEIGTLNACEWRCTDTHVKEGNSCVPKQTSTPRCTDVSAETMQLCTGDELGFSQNMRRTLVTTCTTTTKCEYQCKPGYTLLNDNCVAGNPITFSSLQPSGTVTASNAVLIATTNRAVQCRYSEVETADYNSMPSTTMTTGTTHSWSLVGLTNGQKTFYIACTDGTVSARTPHTFTVQTSTGPGGVPPGQPAAIQLAASPPAIQVGGGTHQSELTATFKNNAGQLLPFAGTIIFTTTAGVLSQSSCTTTAQQSSCAVILQSSQTPGTATVTATYGTISDQATVEFRTEPIDDTSAPLISNPQPQDIVTSLPFTLRVSTDESARCRYATTAGVPFDSMEHQTIIQNVHEWNIAEISNGIHNFYIKCADLTTNNQNRNKNQQDFVHTVSVQVPTNLQPASLQLGASNPVIEPNGVSTTTITATFRNNAGNPVPVSRTVTFTTSAGSLLQNSCQTSGDSLCSVTLRSSQMPGIATVSGVSGSLSGEIGVQFASGAPTSCGGIEPSGNGVVKGVSAYVAGYVPTLWTYDASATSSTPCKWTCDAGYMQSGNACIAAGAPSGGGTCGGAQPENAAGVVKGALTYSSGYTPTIWTYAGDATTSTPCKWKCSDGYTQSGNTCMSTGGGAVNVCIGTFANAQICSGDDQGLSVDANSALVDSCTSAKCEYRCSSGFTKQGNECIPAAAQLNNTKITAIAVADQTLLRTPMIVNVTIQNMRAELRSALVTCRFNSTPVTSSCISLGANVEAAVQMSSIAQAPGFVSLSCSVNSTADSSCQNTAFDNLSVSRGFVSEPRMLYIASGTIPQSVLLNTSMNILMNVRNPIETRYGKVSCGFTAPDASILSSVSQCMPVLQNTNSVFPIQMIASQIGIWQIGQCNVTTSKTAACSAIDNVSFLDFNRQIIVLDRSNMTINSIMPVRASIPLGDVAEINVSVSNPLQIDRFGRASCRVTRPNGVQQDLVSSLCTPMPFQSTRNFILNFTPSSAGNWTISSCSIEGSFNPDCSSRSQEDNVGSSEKIAVQSATGSFVPVSVSVSHSPSEPRLGDTVIVTASSSSSNLRQIRIQVDDQFRTCSTSPCSISDNYRTGTHTYFAIAENAFSQTARDPVNGTKPFTVVPSAGNVSTGGCSIVISSPSCVFNSRTQRYDVSAVYSWRGGDHSRIIIDGIEKIQTPDTSNFTYVQPVPTPGEKTIVAKVQDSGSRDLCSSSSKTMCAPAEPVEELIVQREMPDVSKTGFVMVKLNLKPGRDIQNFTIKENVMHELMPINIAVQSNTSFVNMTGPKNVPLDKDYSEYKFATRLAAGRNMTISYRLNIEKEGEYSFLSISEYEGKRKEERATILVTNCAKPVRTLAVSPDGQCAPFRTDCEVPIDWRKVEECPLGRQETEFETPKGTGDATLTIVIVVAILVAGIILTWRYEDEIRARIKQLKERIEKWREGKEEKKPWEREDYGNSA